MATTILWRFVLSAKNFPRFVFQQPARTRSPREQLCIDDTSDVDKGPRPQRTNRRGADLSHGPARYESAGICESARFGEEVRPMPAARTNQHESLTPHCGSSVMSACSILARKRITSLGVVS